MHLVFTHLKLFLFICIYSPFSVLLCHIHSVCKHRFSSVCLGDLKLKGLLSDRIVAQTILCQFSYENNCFVIIVLLIAKFTYRDQKHNLCMFAHKHRECLIFPIFCQDRSWRQSFPSALLNLGENQKFSQ